MSVMDAIRNDLVGGTYIDKNGVSQIVALALGSDRYEVVLVTPEGGHSLCERTKEEIRSFNGTYLGKHVVSGMVATRHRYDVISIADSIDEITLMSYKDTDPDEMYFAVPYSSGDGVFEGKVVLNKKKCTEYVIVKKVTEATNVLDGKTGIEYVSKDASEGRVYSRETGEFHEKFAVIEEIDPYLIREAKRKATDIFSSRYDELVKESRLVKFTKETQKATFSVLGTEGTVDEIELEV
jgi:hypothetical protein